MKINLIMGVIVFAMICVIGFCMPEFNGSLEHFGIVLVVSLSLGIVGSLESAELRGSG